MTLRTQSIVRVAALMGLMLMAASLAPAVQTVYEHNFTSIPKTPPPISDWMTAPATPIAHEVRGYSLYVLALVSPFLIGPQLALLYAIFKFRADGVRKPATFHENVPLEITWTVIPALVLVLMTLPAYFLIKKMENPPTDNTMTVQITGHQFFWEYGYPGTGVRMSDVPLVIPVGKNVIADITSSGVNHAWWVPAFGVKMDAVPGRITHVWFNVEKPGWYKGQCAELCGALHGNMLIDVHAVTQEEYDAWMAGKIAELAPAPAVADADPTPTETALAAILPQAKP